jgi:alpha-galactosidase
MGRFLPFVVAALAAAAVAPTPAATAAEPEPPPSVAVENLAPTPPMGWNSWNKFACDIDEELIRETADAMVASGMRDAGYTYVNIDDCWQAPERDEQGRLQADPERFPSGIEALADYVHARGLKLGIYSSAGTETCAGYPASLDHEQIDAQTWADWGVDYLKYDNCANQGRPALERYRAMGEALRATGRPIVYALCEWGQNQPWEGLGEQVGAHLWRTTGDITDNWNSVMGILDQQVGLEKYSGPNAWNDPDMLEVGNAGINETEAKAHFALWSLLNAPLIAGNDLRSMGPSIKRILLNRDLIAVNQDWAGIQGHKVRDDGDQEVWVKPMSDGSAAVVLLNRGERNAVISGDDAEIGLAGQRSLRVRDLWTKEEFESAGTIRAAVPAHGAAVYRVWPQQTHGAAPLSTFNLAAPELVEDGKPFTVTATLHNDGRTPLGRPRVQLQAPEGWTVEDSAVVEAGVVRGGDSFQAEWTLTPRPFLLRAEQKLRLTASASFHTVAGAQSRWSTDTPALVTAPPQGDNPLSALPFVSASNGWGPVERDTSNGEQPAGDGQPISIGGVGYDSGLGVHAVSSVRVYLGGGCTTFAAQVGVDDEKGGAGSVEFRVLGDGQELAATGVLRGGQAATPVAAGLAGVDVLELQVTDGGDGNDSDHADWARATITC